MKPRQSSITSASVKAAWTISRVRNHYAVSRLALWHRDHPDFRFAGKKYGFTVDQIEVPHPGNEQKSQWLNIRPDKPDWVILRGWGVMNPVALKNAQQTGFPRDHFIGKVG